VGGTQRTSYDAVVVGARCAGSPLAARLAERGRSVLLVDREPPPADTLSTHCVFPNTLARRSGSLAPCSGSKPSTASIRCSTPQGISDAIEQSMHVADALTGAGESLDGYEAWRDERAREHYEFSFDFGRFARPEVAGPMFAGLAADPEAGQEFRDSFSRLKRPRSDVFTRERLRRWFS